VEKAMKIGNLIKWEANERYGIVVDIGEKIVSIAWIGYTDLQPSVYYLGSLIVNTFRVIG
jgi:hypothetical protein